MATNIVIVGTTVCVPTELIECIEKSIPRPLSFQCKSSSTADAASGGGKDGKKKADYMDRDTIWEDKNKINIERLKLHIKDLIKATRGMALASTSDRIYEKITGIGEFDSGNKNDINRSVLWSVEYPRPLQFKTYSPVQELEASLWTLGCACLVKALYDIRLPITHDTSREKIMELLRQAADCFQWKTQTGALQSQAEYKAKDPMHLHSYVCFALEHAVCAFRYAFMAEEERMLSLKEKWDTSPLKYYTMATESFGTAVGLMENRQGIDDAGAPLIAHMRTAMEHVERWMLVYNCLAYFVATARQNTEKEYMVIEALVYAKSTMTGAWDKEQTEVIVKNIESQCTGMFASPLMRPFNSAWNYYLSAHGTGKQCAEKIPRGEFAPEGEFYDWKISYKEFSQTLN